MNKFIYSYLVVSGIALFYLAFEVYQLKTPELIRTQGIIVTDHLGRDRILIGAPFPQSIDRVRTDSQKVIQYWASRYPGEDYMKWYQDYQHTGNGILIMNEFGFDKVLIGDQLPDPNTGKRNGYPTGLLWNDDMGYERGGLGLNQLKSVDDSKKDKIVYRNVIGFDDETGEALHIGLLEDGTKFIRMAWQDSVLLMGRANAGSFLFNNRSSFVGFQFKSVLDSIGVRNNLLRK